MLISYLGIDSSIFVSGCLTVFEGGGSKIGDGSGKESEISDTEFFHPPQNDETLITSKPVKLENGCIKHQKVERNSLHLRNPNLSFCNVMDFQLKEN